MHSGVPACWTRGSWRAAVLKACRLPCHMQVASCLLARLATRSRKILRFLYDSRRLANRSLHVLATIGNFPGVSSFLRIQAKHARSTTRLQQARLLESKNAYFQVECAVHERYRPTQIPRRRWIPRTHSRLLECPLLIGAGRIDTGTLSVDPATAEVGALMNQARNTFVKTLRHKPGDDDAAPTYIVNERGVGYRMAGPRVH